MSEDQVPDLLEVGRNFIRHFTETSIADASELAGITCEI